MEDGDRARAAAGWDAAPLGCWSTEGRPRQAGDDIEEPPHWPTGLTAARRSGSYDGRPDGMAEFASFRCKDLFHGRPSVSSAAAPGAGDARPRSRARVDGSIGDVGLEDQPPPAVAGSVTVRAQPHRVWSDGEAALGRRAYWRGQRRPIRSTRGAPGRFLVGWYEQGARPHRWAGSGAARGTTTAGWVTQEHSDRCPAPVVSCK